MTLYIRGVVHQLLFEPNDKAHNTEKSVQEDEILLLHGNNYQHKQAYLSFTCLS
jgi:hypothetical protein